MSKEAELRQLIVELTASMQPAGILLATIATSRSKYSEEAWAAFSHLSHALNLVRAVVERDSAGSVQ